MHVYPKWYRTLHSGGPRGGGMRLLKIHTRN